MYSNHLAFNVSAPSDSDLFEAALIGFRQIARLYWAARNHHKFQYRLLADSYTHGSQCVSAHRTKRVTLLVHFALHLYTNWSVDDDGKEHFSACLEEPPEGIQLD